MVKLSRPRSRGASTNRVRPGLESLEDRCVPSNSAAFLGVDTTTQGSWQGHYGSTGYLIQGDPSGSKVPSQDQIDISSGTSTYTYANPTDNLRGLQKVADPTSRIEAGWFNYIYHAPTTGFDVTLKVPGNQVNDPATPVSLYVEDWDGGNRSETIQPLDASSRAPLGPAQTVSNFRDGQYLSWAIKGNVVFHIEKLTGPSAVLSAVFLGGASAAPPAGGSAAFVGPNTTANGNWQSVPFGTEGYNVYGATPDYSSYGTVSYYGDSFGTYTFAASTSDPRGLQSPDVPGGRIAVAQYGASFTLDVNITDGLAHELTLYAVDWDNAGRSERFDLFDNTTGARLDCETLSNFAGGAYLSWDVLGHVQVRVTALSGPNAVVMGEFFDKDPPPLHGALTPLTTSPTTSTVGTPSGPRGGTNNSVTFLPPGALNGVDVVLLDRLFANGHHLSDPDFGGPTGGIG